MKGGSQDVVEGRRQLKNPKPVETKGAGIEKVFSLFLSGRLRMAAERGVEAK